MRATNWWTAFGVASMLSACAAFGSSGGETIAPNPVQADGMVSVLLDQPLAEISPLTRGVSGEIGQFIDAGVTLNSWGGERATRFNYQLGNAWNLARGGAYRNEGVITTDDLLADWLAANGDANVASRVAVPGLGWVARNGDASTCSFSDGDSGGCLTAQEFDCSRTGPIADPAVANVGSTPPAVGEWISGYVERDVRMDYLAVDNEPERWGVEHYDVHPTCPSYLEIFGTYVAYASKLRSVAPDALLAGPAMCCWFGYDDAPGPPDPGSNAATINDSGPDDNTGLLRWFLGKLGERDPEPDGGSLLDVVDVHFRPRADVVNSRSDPTTDKLRIESVGELWSSDGAEAFDVADRTQVQFLCRMRTTIDEFSPSLPLMISDWRFGGEDSMSGAIAVSEALGIFAQEGVHATAHAETLAVGTPGWFAFKMFGNYDDRGSAFQGTAFTVEVEELPDICVFAAGDDTTLRLLLINTSPNTAQRVGLALGGVETVGGPTLYIYSSDALDGIVAQPVRPTDIGGTELPASSISMLEIRARRSLEPEAADAEG
jgi:hypothetical protein